MQRGLDPSTLVDQLTFRSAMSLLPTGVTVVTVGRRESLEAVTVNSLTSLSLEPLLIVVGLRLGGRVATRLERADAFAVHVLAADQRHLAVLFARRDRPSGRTADLTLRTAETPRGNVLIGGALVSLECQPFATHPGGDHLLVVGRVVAIHGVGAESTAPLVFHRGDYERGCGTLSGSIAGTNDDPISLGSVRAGEDGR
jgi:3-hydroxy-9,10-secoandrosta-1,3,5(10)-triene-9,17-dione monooxygenase reductase component